MSSDRRYRPYLWLAMGFALLLVSNGNWIVPLAAWLAPVFLIRFLRTQGVVRGVLPGVLAYIVAYAVMWKGFSPVPDIVYYVSAPISGLIFFLPFLADRLLAPALASPRNPDGAFRWREFTATLAFPLAQTTLEYLFSLTDNGAWGSLAYTQYGNLPLVQVVSVTGVWGPGFLIAWFASMVNWAWEREFAWSKVRVGVGLYAGVLASVLLFGGARLALFPPRATTVRVAAIVTPREIEARFSACESTSGIDWECVREASAAAQEDLLARSQQQARAGARIVFWQEGAVYVLQDDEAALIQRGCELARREELYLGMAVGTVPQGFPDQPLENKVVLIDPAGIVRWEYRKFKLVPGVETSVPGDGVIPVLETPYGRIATVICFDLDFPDYVRQAGQSGVDLLLAPSNDWEAIDPLHTHMAAFRAVENGCSLVRPTGHGLSIAVDYQGRVLAATDYFATEDPVMVAHVPIRGTRTLYAAMGDLFAWLCVAGFAMLAGRVVVRRLTMFFEWPKRAS